MVYFTFIHNYRVELLMVEWRNPGKAVILASGSPRRKQILSTMGFSFDTITPPSIEELDYIDQSDPKGSLADLAVVKAKAIAEKFPQALVLGADTIVVSNNNILGKPGDKQDAFRMLKDLSGKSHSVMTGAALLCDETGFCTKTVAVTNVFFRDISE